MSKQPIKSVPKHDRPREKMLAKGPGALSGQELAAVLLGSGIKGHNVMELADEIVKKLAERQRIGNGPGNTSAQHTTPDSLLDELRSITGIGPAKAAQVAAAFELARRYLDSSRIRIKQPEDVIPLVSFIAERKQEHLVCVSLNGAHEVIATRVVSVGTLDESLAHPREVFTDPIVDRAAAVILVHNHTCGDVEPSLEDRKITDRFSEAGKILGIEVIDHLIVSGNQWRSIKNPPSGSEMP